jgi:hypothetical protein
MRKMILLTLSLAVVLALAPSSGAQTMVSIFAGNTQHTAVLQSHRATPQHHPLAHVH